MSPTSGAFWMGLLLLLLLVACTERAAATRYAAGNDIVLDAQRRLHLAYIVEEDDIMVKMACTCMARNHCHSRDNVQLTEDKCSNPDTCCVTTDTAGIDFDKY